MSSKNHEKIQEKNGQLLFAGIKKYALSRVLFFAFFFAFYNQLNYPYL